MLLWQRRRHLSRLTRACRACQALEGAAPLPGCTAGTAEAIRLDLSSLASVRECVAAYSKRRAPLDLLVCNAGVMAPPRRMQVGAGRLCYLLHQRSLPWTLCAAWLAPPGRLAAEALRARRPRTAWSSSSRRACPGR